jgi:phage shock protein PspC (stress-responsive transcriptional regulator)
MTEPNINNSVYRHRLYRSREDRIIAGVCGGLGEYFNVDAILIRLVFVLLALLGGHGILLYIILMVVIPNQPGPAVSVDRKEKIKEFAAGVQAGVGAAAKQLKDKESWFSQPRHFAGSIIFLIGLAALFSQMFPQYWLGWDIMWPLLLVAVGLYVIISK